MTTATPQAQPQGLMGSGWRLCLEVPTLSCWALWEGTVRSCPSIFFVLGK